MLALGHFTYATAVRARFGGDEAERPKAAIGAAQVRGAMETTA
jgi:hypothetical protein